MAITPEHPSFKPALREHGKPDRAEVEAKILVVEDLLARRRAELEHRQRVRASLRLRDRLLRAAAEADGPASDAGR